MKENKYIQEKTGLLDKDVVTIKDTNVAILGSGRFIRVAEFSNEVVRRSQSKKKVEEETITFNEDGTAMYYAEEVFDDEDDLYSNELKDRMVEKSKYKTYKEMASLIDEAMESRGLSGRFGLDLLSAMNYSHFIRFEKEPSEKFLKSFFEMFELNRFSFDASEENDSISHLSNIFPAINAAKNDPEKPVFFYVNNLESKKVLEFFRPLYYFIDNPTGENYLTGQGRSVSIPNNFFIIFSLKEGQVPFDISRRLLRYVATLPVEQTEVERQPQLLGVSLSITELTRSLGNAMNEVAVSEDGWRKFDALSNVIGDINGYSMHNKIVRRNEQYLTVLLSAGVEENEAIDISLARNIISEAIITSRPQDYVDDHDLERTLEQYFGAGNTPLTIKVIKEYLVLFDKGGNRIEN
ncbi:MAG: hypothetical protein MJZ37_04725 [Bacilli bacterium]|nr:hypothetical protein [Bacilli bacterium]